jgi:hypothetical protein
VTTSDAQQQASINAYRMHSQHDGRATTAAGRAAFLGRFETEVDPDGLLTADERARRVDAAKSAYFRALALRSAQVRRKRALR